MATGVRNQAMNTTAASVIALPVRWVRERSGALLSHGALLMAALLAVGAWGAALSPTFLTGPNFRNIMLNVSIVGVLALGQTLVMIMRQIDLSVGSLMAFAPILAINLTESVVSLSGGRLIQGGSYVTGGTGYIIVLTVVVATLVGILNGVLVVRGLVPSLIVTLGMLYALRGATFNLSGGHSLYLTDLDGLRWLGATAAYDLFPVSFIFFVGLSVVVIAILKYTKVGPRIYAIGANERGAVYSGLDPRRWKLLGFAFSGFCAGVAALFFSARLVSVEASQGSGLELEAIAIAVVGGTTLAGGRGSMLKTVLASLLLALVINIASLLGLVVWYKSIILGLIIVVAALGNRYSGRSRRYAVPESAVSSTER